MNQIRTIQYEPYSGPALLGGLPKGDMLQVVIPDDRLGISSNNSCRHAWDVINEEAQKISFHTSGLQEMPSKDLIDEILKGCDRVFAEVSQSIASRTNQLFADTFGGPPPYAYQRWAIRWPGENELSYVAIMRFVSAA